jgi:hypothetical protein
MLKGTGAQSERPGGIIFGAGRVIKIGRLPINLERVLQRREAANRRRLAVAVASDDHLLMHGLLHLALEEEAPWRRRHRKLKFFWLVWSLCC